MEKLSTKFKVGAELIKITGISVPDIEPGGVARFKVNVESFWAEEIPNVFAEVNVLNADEGGARSESKTVEAWGTQDFMVFWDSEKNPPGDYDVEVSVHFLGKKTTEKTVLRIIQPKMEIPWPLVAAVIAAIIALYLAYRFLLPRLKPLLAPKKRKKGVAGELSVRGARAGEPVEFVLRVFNNSGKAVEGEAVFDVFDQEGIGVASLKGGKQKIGAGEIIEFVARLPASKVRAGSYLASATLSYDGKEGVVEKTFSLREEEKPPWEKYR